MSVSLYYVTVICTFEKNVNTAFLVLWFYRDIIIIIIIITIKVYESQYITYLPASGSKRETTKKRETHYANRQISIMVARYENLLTYSQTRQRNTS